MLGTTVTVLGAGGLAEPWDSILHWVMVAGIALFFWSVSCSMERIAKALTRIADDKDARRNGGRSEEPPSP